MNALILKIAFVVYAIGISVIRKPHERRNKQNIVASNHKGTLEKVLLIIVALGFMVLPAIYLLTPFLSFANFNLPLYAHILGIILIIPTLWLFYRSHKDLGKNWSVTLEIREEHKIVDSGVYKYIRHPMYSALWIGGVIQFLLLNNYIAGLSGIITFGLLYLFRVNNEEKMMIKEFGQEYEDYIKKTKRIIPFVH